MRRAPIPTMSRVASQPNLPTGAGLMSGNGPQTQAQAQARQSANAPSSSSYVNDGGGGGGGGKASDREGGRGRAMTVSFMLNADSVSLSTDGGEGKGGQNLTTAQKSGEEGRSGGGYSKAELMGAIATAVAAVPSSSSSDSHMGSGNSSSGGVSNLTLPGGSSLVSASGGGSAAQRAKSPYRFSFRYSEQGRAERDIHTPTPYDDLTYESALTLADAEGLTIPVEDFVGVCIDHWEAECARLFREIDRIATQASLQPLTPFQSLYLPSPSCLLLTSPLPLLSSFLLPSGSSTHRHLQTLRPLHHRSLCRREGRTEEIGPVAGTPHHQEAVRTSFR